MQLECQVDIRSSCNFISGATDQLPPYTITVLWPYFWDHPGEPVPEENFWTLWCKGRLKAKFHYASWFGAGSKLVRAEIWPII